MNEIEILTGIIVIQAMIIVVITYRLTMSSQRRIALHELVISREWYIQRMEKKLLECGIEDINLKKENDK